MAKNQANTQVNASTALVSTGKGGLLGSATNHIAGKALPFLPPWAGAAIAPPVAGLITHEMWGDSALSAGIACAGLGTSGIALSAMTWAVSGGNNTFRRIRRAHATASVAAGMGWLTCATAAGPFSTGMLNSWVFGGSLFALSWNIRGLMRNAHDETETVEKGGWAKLAEKIGLEKVQVSNAKGSGKGTVTANVEVGDGKTVEDVQATAGKLAAALHLPPSGVTVTRDPDNAARGTMSLRVADLLKDGVEFIPPQRLGLLPTADIPIGLYANGETCLINPFDAAILQHLLVMGVTGAGKSEFCRTVLAHLMTRSKMSIWLIDLAKGRQSVGHMAEGLDWFIQDAKTAKLALKALPGMIAARGDRLADEGLDQWAPGSSLNAMLIWMEEAADLVDFDKLDEVARKARSVGIWLVVSLQRATWTNVRTDVRANLQASACFGVDDAGDAGFGLPDRVVESGAVPDWGSDRPGYFYATGMGIPQRQWTTEVRGSYTGDVKDEIVDMIRAAAAVRDPLDEVTAKAAGLVYAQRAHKGSNRTSPHVVTAGPVAAQLETVPDQDITDEEQDVADEIQDVYDEVMGQIPGDPEPDADYANIPLDGEMPETDEDSGITFGDQTDRTAEEARHILYVELDGFARTGRLSFEPADLIPATVAAGRKRPWMQAQLKKLVEQGVLTKDGHGEYTIVESPLVSA
ncbi:hypothetical protein ACWGRL_28160 [[Kitasatospora] papulosa]